MNILEMRIRAKSDEKMCWDVNCRHSQLNKSPIEVNGKFQIEDRDKLEQAAIEPSKYKEYGQQLGETLFKDAAVRDGFNAAVNSNSERERLRVLLYIEAQELTTLRWEKLCVPTESGWQFARLDRRVTFSVYVPSPVDISRFPAISKRDLRALVLVASPKDQSSLKEFSVKETVDSIQAVFKNIHCHVLANGIDGCNAPTLSNLRKELNEKPPYTLLHIVCHGLVDRDKKDISLYWATDDHKTERIQGSTLIENLSQFSTPHFTFLSVCDSASATEGQALGGLAGRLVRELGMPAVVAMLDKVEIKTAQNLAERFYKNLMESGQIDLALAEAIPPESDTSHIIVPALFSRLAGLPLFSDSLAKELNDEDIKHGLNRLLEVNQESENEMPDDSDDLGKKKNYVSLIQKYAPILEDECQKLAKKLRDTLGDEMLLTDNAKQERKSELQKLNDLCKKVFSNQMQDFTFNALALDRPLPKPLYDAHYDARCPFQGLRSFNLKSKDFFFGRDTLIEDLKNALEKNNFLAVIGGSGSGKSSVVLAGLIPKLLGDKSEQMAYLTPSKTPRDELNKILEKNAKPPILVVDQFEELFTLSDKTQRQEFINRLLELISSEQTVVITMRVDFWDECANYGEGFQKLIQDKDSQFLIQRMTSDELRNAMEEQAEKVGLRFEGALSKLIWTEVEGEPGAMPLLQHALGELWKRRHGQWLLDEEYKNIGTDKAPGLKGALANTADDFYAKLKDEEKGDEKQYHFKNIFLKLTQIDDNTIAEGGEPRYLRKKVELGNLVTYRPGSAKGYEDDRPIVEELVNRLASAEARLVVTSTKDGENGEKNKYVMVEVAHEALLRHWGQLKKWLKENSQNVRLRSDIEKEASKWKSEGKKLEDLVRKGFRLDDAIVLLEKGFLGADEAEYVEECRKDSDRQEQKQLEASLDVGITSSQLLFASNKKLDALLNLINTGTNLREGLEKYEYSRLRFLVMLEYVFGELAEYNSINAHKDEVTSVSWSPDNKIIASASSRGIIKLWPRDDTPKIFIDEKEGNNEIIWDLSFSPDGRLLASAGDNGSIKLWQISGKEYKDEEKTLLGHRSRVESVSFSPDGEIIVSGSADGTVRFWNRKGDEIQPPLKDESRVKFVAFSPDGNQIASAYEKGVIKLWSRDGNLLKSIDEKSSDGAHIQDVTSVNFSPDSKILVSSDRDGWIKIWTTDKQLNAAEFGRLVNKIKQKKEVLYVTFSPDGKLIASTDIDGTIKLWLDNDKHWSNKLRLFRTLKHEKEVRKVIFSKDSKKLISCSYDKTIKSWNCFSKFDGYDSKGKFDGHSDWIRSIDFNRVSKTIATASQDGTIKIWDYNGVLIQNLSNHTVKPYEEVKFSYDGNNIVAVNEDEVILWCQDSGLPYRSIPIYREAVKSISCSPIDNLCAVVCKNGTIKILDFNGKTVQSMAEEREEITKVAFSSDGRMIASVSGNGSVKLWRREGKTFQSKLIPDANIEGSLYYVSFSDDDKIIATVDKKDGNSEIKLWSVNNGSIKPLIFDSRQITTKSNTKTRILDLKFCFDNKVVILVCEDYRIDFWDWGNSLLKPIALSDKKVSAASFSPNGTAIAIADYEREHYENRISLWNFHLEETLEKTGKYIQGYPNLAD